MFKRREQPVESIVMRILRSQGLETPLLQRRLLQSWPEVAGEAVARFTTGLQIRNQTLYVSLNSPALRADLSMRRKQLVQMLNTHVGAQVIADIRFN
jgi:predicted nucleic acid-binding Zn ribbon protein